MKNDEFPSAEDQKPTPIEEELTKKGRRRHGHPSHTETHPLTAKEEAARRKRSPKAKKYDGRAHARTAVVSREAVKGALEAFYKEVKLPELKQALEVSNDPRYNMLLAAINNPRFHNCSFSELCRKCRMSIQDVVEVWRNHMKTAGIVRIMGHMPDIMEDVALDSKSKTVVCDMCQGEGKLLGQTVNRIEDPICPSCHGDGTIRINGDKDARMLAFETVGLRKGSVGQVNVVNVNRGVPSIEDQISSIDRVFDVDYQEVPQNEPSNGIDNGNEAGNQGASESSSGPRAKLLPQPPYVSSKNGPTRVGADSGEAEDREDPTDYSS